MLCQRVLMSIFAFLLMWCPLSSAISTTPPPSDAIRKVNVPPLILEEPAVEVPFVIHESVRLPCYAESTPDPKYNWLMDEKPFEPSGTEGRIATQPGEGTLIFADPIERDQALYQCLAENLVGTAVTVKTNLRLSYLESFVDTDKVYTLKPVLGESVTLICKPPASYPRAQFFWVKVSGLDRFEVVTMDNRVTMDPLGNLHFSNVRLEDETRDEQEYMCAVKNQVVRRTVYGYRHKFLPQGGSPRTAVVGLMYADTTQRIGIEYGVMEICCIFSGNPTPRVTWRRENANGRMPEHVEIKNFGTKLVFNKVEYSDVGNYECAGINDVTKSPFRRSFNILVEGKPKWTVIPQSVDVAEGENAVFHCNATGIPLPQFFWLLNGIPVSKVASDTRRIVEANKLSFYNVTKEDSMTVQCNATNKHGYIFANAYLNVRNEPATILQRPIDGQKAAEGETVELRCEVYGSPKPYVIWRRGTEQLTGGKFSIMDKGNLRITDVSSVDAGTYTCLTGNQHGNDSAAGSLIVRRHTRIVIRPMGMQMVYKTEAKLSCTATTDPDEVHNLQILWLKDGQFINYAKAHRIFQNELDNSLTITGTICLDTGRYTCMAKTEIDNDTASAHLMVQAPPDPPNKPLVRCTQPGKKNITDIEWTPGKDNYAPVLQYIVQFNTTFQPDTWYSIGPTNLTNEQRKISVSLSPWGNYTFRVIARNKIGWSFPSPSSDQVCTTEPGLPVKHPENVIGEGDEPNNLVVFWTPMPQIDHNADGFKYIVGWQRMDIPGAKEDSYTVEQWDVWHHWISLDYQDPPVPPYTQFLVWVRAINSVGEAAVPVQKVVGYSGEAVPLVSPTDVTVVGGSVTSTSVDLQWTHVDTSPATIKGFFTGYRVQYGRKTEWPNNIWEEDFIIHEPAYYPRPRPRVTRQIVKNGTNADNKVQVTLTHLPAYSDVVAQVRVLNKYYAGPASSQVEVTTLEGLPGPPSLFVVVSRGPTLFELEWKAPYDINGVLVGYNISYQTMTGLSFGLLEYRAPIDDPAATRAQLPGLSSDTTYRVYLSAVTQAGSGDHIFLDAKTLPPTAPTPPTFSIPEVNDTYMKVVWEPSQTSDNPGSVFYVQYRKRTVYPWEQSPDQFIDKFMYILELKPGTVYQVRVTAKNGEGLESPAEYLEVQTDGHAEGTYDLATSPWFYGIFLSILLVVVIFVVFMVIKHKYADPRWQRIEEEIEEEERLEEAQAAVMQMGFPPSAVLQSYHEGTCTKDEESVVKRPIHDSSSYNNQSYN